MSKHIHPLNVETSPGVFREATEEELQDFLSKGGRNATNWLKSNRIDLAKRLLASGVSHAAAWTEAFSKYPDPTKGTFSRPKYTIRLP